MKFRRSCKENTAFTLTELAITLGIMGLVLGGLWTALGAVNENVQVKSASEEMMVVVQNMRSLYANQNKFTIDGGASAVTADTDQTTAMVSASVFPQSMLTTSLPYNVWRGRVYVKGGASSGVFRYYVYGIPTLEECIRLIATNVGANGLYCINTGSGWLSSPSLAAVNANCSTGTVALSSLSCIADGTQYRTGFEFSLWDVQQ